MMIRIKGSACITLLTLQAGHPDVTHHSHSSLIKHCSHEKAPRAAPLKASSRSVVAFRPCWCCKIERARCEACWRICNSGRSMEWIIVQWSKQSDCIEAERELCWEQKLIEPFSQSSPVVTCFGRYIRITCFVREILANYPISITLLKIMNFICRHREWRRGRHDV